MTVPPTTPTPPATAHEGVAFESADLMVRTLGPQDALLRILGGVFPTVDVTVRDQRLDLAGPVADVASVRRVVEDLRSIARRDQAVTPEVMGQVVHHVRDAATGRGAGQLHLDSILSGRGRRIRAKTLHQQDYVEAIDRSTVVFGIGPAGTGKTYLAMAKAVAALALTLGLLVVAAAASAVAVTTGATAGTTLAAGGLAVVGAVGAHVEPADWAARALGIGIAIVGMRVMPLSAFLGIPVTTTPPFPMVAAVIGLVAATAVGALAGIIPAIVATRIRPIDAIRY